MGKEKFVNDNIGDSNNIKDNTLEQVIDDNKIIENRCMLIPAYKLCNKLYNAVPEEFSKLIRYEPSIDALYFNGEELGRVHVIQNIEIIEGEIFDNDKSKHRFDKEVYIITAEWITILTFYYGLNNEKGRYEYVEFEVKRKIYAKCEIGERER